MKNIERFEELIEQYQYFLLDTYGVFWGSAQAGIFPGAANTMEHLVAKGKSVVLLSNSTQLATREKEKYAKYTA